MQIAEQEITFKTLNTGDKRLDAIYFISIMFERYSLTEEEQKKILLFLMPKDLTPAPAR